MSDAPGATLPCARCGVSLLAGVSPGEVITVGGRRLGFRRTTDFIVCQRCLALYRVRDLSEGRVIPVTDTELLSQGEAADAGEAIPEADPAGPSSDA